LKNLDKKHVGNIEVAVDPFNKNVDLSIMIREKSVWGIKVASWVNCGFFCACLIQYFN
jgi:hypothetical protein